MATKYNNSGPNRFLAARQRRVIVHLLPSIRECDLVLLSRIPEDILSEIASFSKRNSLAVVAHDLEERKEKQYCCPRCLKAHIVRKCEEFHVCGAARKLLSDLLACESGHDGYYIDRGELVKL